MRIFLNFLAFFDVFMSEEEEERLILAIDVIAKSKLYITNLRPPWRPLFNSFCCSTLILFYHFPLKIIIMINTEIMKRL